MDVGTAAALKQGPCRPLVALHHHTLVTGKSVYERRHVWTKPQRAVEPIFCLRLCLPAHPLQYEGLWLRHRCSTGCRMAWTGGVSRPLAAEEQDDEEEDGGWCLCSWLIDVSALARHAPTLDIFTFTPHKLWVRLFTAQCAAAGEPLRTGHC